MKDEGGEWQRMAENGALNHSELDLGARRGVDLMLNTQGIHRGVRYVRAPLHFFGRFGYFAEKVEGGAHFILHPSSFILPPSSFLRMAGLRAMMN